MLQSILKLQGAQPLSQTEQKQIEGGRRNFCTTDAECSYPQTCVACICTAPGDPV